MFQIATPPELTPEKYSPGIIELIKNFSRGITEYDGMRWTICGKVDTCIEALKEAGVFEPWMEGHLHFQNQLAIESL